ncbi:MAG: Ig-like domain-containing protein [Spirochaetaceae bacterium]|nr:Ig-like domain-containing protein [Spirochaetaceae bacterium]
MRTHQFSFSFLTASAQRKPRRGLKLCAVAAAFILLFGFAGCEQPDDDGDEEINIGKIGGPDKGGGTNSGGGDQTGNNPPADNLTIHPAQISVKAGGKQQFTAKVGGGGGIVEAEWSIEGEAIEDSRIGTSSGLLTVGETASGTITVKAVAEGKTRTAFVTILPSDMSFQDIEDAPESYPLNYGLSVEPSIVDLPKGGMRQFAARSSDGSVVNNVEWSVTGKQSEATDINEGGLLTIGNDETAEMINVLAKIDDETFGTAVVNITSSSGGSEDESDDAITGKPVLNNGWEFFGDENIRIKSIAHGKVNNYDIFSAVSYDGTKLLYSTDYCDNWQLAGGWQVNSVINRIRFLDNSFYAVGDGSVVLKSTDGKNWMPVTFDKKLVYKLRDIAYDNDEFIIVGCNNGGNGVVISGKTSGGDSWKITEMDTVNNDSIPELFAVTSFDKLSLPPSSSYSTLFLIGGAGGCLYEYSDLEMTAKSSCDHQINDILYLDTATRFFLTLKVDDAGRYETVYFQNFKVTPPSDSLLKFDNNTTSLISVSMKSSTTQFIATTSDGFVISAP